MVEERGSSVSKYDVHYSSNRGLKSGISHPLLNDIWVTEIVDALSKEKAIEVVNQLEKDKGNKVNYILSCEEI